MTLTAMDLVANAKKTINEISIKDATQKNVLLLDVREPEEFIKGHIDEAINIPRGILEFQIHNFPQFNDKNAEIIVYCQSGGRSALAVEALQKLGYTQAVSMEGGYNAWINS